MLSTSLASHRRGRLACSGGPGRLTSNTRVLALPSLVRFETSASPSGGLPRSPRPDVWLGVCRASDLNDTVLEYPLKYPLISERIRGPLSELDPGRRPGSPTFGSPQRGDYTFIDRCNECCRRLQHHCRHHPPPCPRSPQTLPPPAHLGPRFPLRWRRADVDRGRPSEAVLEGRTPQRVHGPKKPRCLECFP